MLRSIISRLVCVVLTAGAVLLAGDSAALAAELGATTPFDHCQGPRAHVASGTALLHVEAHGRADGVTRSSALFSWWNSQQEVRVLLQMLAPEEVAGSSFLLIDAVGERPQAWAYLPAIEKVKRVGSRHLRKPLFGTNLSYEDFERARTLASSLEIRSWRETDLDGRPAWRLVTEVTEQGQDTIVTWLDQETCVPLRSELTDRKGRLARQIDVSSEPAPMGVASTGFVPRSLIVRDLLARTETRVSVEAVELAETPSPETFDPARLGLHPEPNPGS